MATVTKMAEIVTSADGTSFTSPAFTPPAGSLLVVMALANTSWNSTNLSPITDSDGGATSDWYWASNAYFGSAAGGPFDVFRFGLRKSGVSGSSMTVTLTSTGSPPATITACVIQIFAVSGMALFGVSALRQQAVLVTASPYYATGIPSVLSMPAACLEANPVFTWLCADGAPDVQPPTGFVTEHCDVGVTIPATGAQVCSIDGGFSGTDIVWTQDPTGRHNARAFELDTTGGTPWEPPAPAPPEVDPIWINSYEIKVLTGR